MKLIRLNLILVPSVLALATPAWGEARQANTKATQPRPLNLSLPHDIVDAPATSQTDDTVQRNLHVPPEAIPPAPARLRYGAGYEQRFQEMGGAAAGGGAAGGSSASGAGGTVGAGRRGR